MKNREKYKAELMEACREGGNLNDFFDVYVKPFYNTDDWAAIGYDAAAILITLWLDEENEDDEEPEEVKTRQSKFLKAFPSAQVIGGLLEIKPCDIDTRWQRTECDKYDLCDECQRDYWYTEVK